MKIVLGGGCFWCLEAAYQMVKGVAKVTSGYAGGTVTNPSYEQVVGGGTGHAEVVMVEFDESVVSLEQVLVIFWTIHDPTTLNRQGADIGTQYRSAIFYVDPHQKAIAEASKQSAQKLWNQPIVTTIEPLEVFYEAEEYHKDYFARHPEQGYCQVVINPKLVKLRKKYHHLLKQS